MTSSANPTKSPPSPTSSFYALSDDEEGEYDTITHTSSGRGVKLLYSKSKVGWQSFGQRAPCADELHRYMFIPHLPRRTISPDI